MNTMTALDRKLQERLLLARRVEGDRLMLSDEVLRAALDGSRALSANERAALQSSPLTLRRLRHLAGERRAASDTTWRRSAGMLRAADSGAALAQLTTDDGCWTLHFAGAGNARRVILQLAAHAPFAERLLDARALLRVLDGEGETVLQGRLDADGECEGAWPFVDEPALHFQRRGARFLVEAADVG
jgi:hypothetical protein